MQKDADAKAVAVPPKDAKPVAKKPRLDCIDGCRFALVFPIVVAHFARFEPQRCHKLPSVVKDGQRQRPGIVIYYILHYIYYIIYILHWITILLSFPFIQFRARHASNASEVTKCAEVQHQQFDGSEASDPGECLGWWLLRDLRICLRLHDDKTWSFRSWREESGESRAFLLAESHGILPIAFPVVRHFCADVHLGGEELQGFLEYDRVPSLFEFQHAAGLVPKGGWDLESAHLVPVSVDILQFDHAHFGVAKRGQFVQEGLTETSCSFVGSLLVAEGQLLGDCSLPQQQGASSGWQGHDAIDLESDTFPPNLGTLWDDHRHYCSSSCHAGHRRGEEDAAHESNLAFLGSIFFAVTTTYEVWLQWCHHPWRALCATLHWVPDSYASRCIDIQSVGNHQVLRLQDHGHPGIPCLLAADGSRFRLDCSGSSW